MSRSDCPLATRDEKMDDDRRMYAIEVASYGPVNPGETNASFWREKAKTWGTDQADARTMRCGNCGSFNNSPEMLICISNLPSVVRNKTVDGDVGFCDTYEFRATSKRVCDSWAPRMSAPR